MIEQKSNKIVICFLDSLFAKRTHTVFTRPVVFPSCVRSLIFYKAVRQKRSKRKAEMSKPILGICRDKCFHTGLSSTFF